MTKTFDYIKKVGLALTITCLLGGQLSAGSGNFHWDDEGGNTPAVESTNPDGKNKTLGYFARAKKKVKPVTDHLSAHQRKYYLALAVVATITTKWLYEKGKVNYLVTNDAVLQDELREIDCNENLNATEIAEEKKKAIARRVAEYFADESLLDAIMKSTRGLLSYVF